MFNPPRDLLPFINADGLLTSLPAKHRKKLSAIYFLATRLPSGQSFSEGQINVLLDGLTTFRDPATLRRELYNHKLLDRAPDGTRYDTPAALPDYEAFMTDFLS